jgi:hypothetical protein
MAATMSLAAVSARVQPATVSKRAAALAPAKALGGAPLAVKPRARAVKAAAAASASLSKEQTVQARARPAAAVAHARRPDGPCARL